MKVFTLVFVLLSILVHRQSAETDQPDVFLEETAPNLPPTVVVVAPFEWAYYYPHESIFCQAFANDPEDGRLFGDSILWSYNGNVVAATDFFELPASNFPFGVNYIDVYAMDSSGLTSPITRVYVQVRPFPQDDRPIVRMLFPKPNQIFSVGEAILLRAETKDVQGLVPFTNDLFSWYIMEILYQCTATLGKSTPALWDQVSTLLQCFPKILLA